MSIIKRTIVDDYLLNNVPKGENPGEHHHKVGSELSIPRIIRSPKLGEFPHTCSDPVFLYLKFCEEFLEKIEEARSGLVPGCLTHPPTGKKFPGKVYNKEKIDQLAQNSMAFIVMLFSGLEAFLNEHIPEDFVYSVIRKVNGEKRQIDLERSEIQRRIGTKEKLAKVYKLILKKDIMEKKNLYNSFLVLKEIRDEINHLKAVKPIPKFKPPEKELSSFNEKGGLSVTCRTSPKKMAELSQDENAWILTNLIDLDARSALSVVIQIMNFFIDDYVMFDDPDTLGELAKKHSKKKAQG